MFFEVNKVPRHCPRQLIELAIPFAYEYCEIPSSIGCEITFVNKKDNFVGSCDYDKDESTSWIYVYNNLYTSDIIRTIFHELVHVSDLISGRLIILEDNSRIWEDIRYDFSLDEESYNETPWESKALYGETVMFEKFKTELDKTLALFLDDSWLETNMRLKNEQY